MNFSTLQELTWYLPDHPALYRNDQVDPREVSYRENKEIERFLMAYRKPKFGWVFTRALHEFGIDMPGTLSQADHDLYRLKSHLMGNREPVIVKAMAMAFAVSEFPVRVGVESVLLTKLANQMAPQKALEYAADFMKLPLSLVTAYEKLFFNITDRLDDEKYLMGIVYPKTRIVENSRSYMSAESVQNLIYRAAYNHGEDDLKQMLGFRDQLSSNSDAKLFAERLESALMANGSFMARNGYLHDPSITAINSARQLIAATKAGGVDSMGDTVMSTLGDSLHEELRNMRAARMLDFQSAVA
jgi:hypothetical protein